MTTVLIFPAVFFLPPESQVLDISDSIQIPTESSPIEASDISTMQFDCENNGYTGSTNEGNSAEASKTDIKVKNKTLTRKRSRNPENWKANKRKLLKNSGQIYETKKENSVDAKKLQAVHCKCAYKCSTAFSQSDREHLFKQYWDLVSYERQRDFLLNAVTKQPCKTHKSDSTKTRSYSVTYYMYQNSTGERKRVCRSFFLTTLDIGKKTIYYALDTSTKLGTMQPDQRGRHPSARKLPTADEEDVLNHIASFPTIASHYCHASSKRNYLDANLNLTKMYELYKQKQQAKIY